MSDYTVNCPKCNAALQVQDEWAGTEAECPTCHAGFTIPPRNAQPGAGPSLSSFQAAPADDTMACPYCGAQIKKAAKVCRFCHQSLAVAAAPASQDIVVKCKECDSFVKAPASMQGQTVACPLCGEDMVLVPATSRKCPQCGEEIKLEAKLCKYCHAALPPVKVVELNGRPAAPGASAPRPAAAPVAGVSAGYGYAMPTATLPVLDSTLSGEMRFFWKGLKLWTILGAATSLACRLFSFIGSLCASEGEYGAAGVFYGVFVVPLGIFALIAMIIMIIKYCKLMFRYWDYIGTGSNLTPGKMVGFCFIPFFNFYWIFRAIWGLAKRLRQAGSADVNPAMALVCCILTCTSVLPWVGGLCEIAAVVFFLITFTQFDKAFVGDMQA